MSFAVHLHCWFSCSGYPVICAENLEADGHNASQIIPFCAWLQKLACFHHISPVGHLDSSRLATLFLAHLTIVCLSLLAMMRIFQKFVLMYHELSFLLLPVFLPIYFKTLRSRQCREACSPMENKAWEGKLEVSFHSQFFPNMHSNLTMEMWLSFLCTTLGSVSDGRDLMDLFKWKCCLGALQTNLYQMGSRIRCNGNGSLN